MTNCVLSPKQEIGVLLVLVVPLTGYADNPQFDPAVVNPDCGSARCDDRTHKNPDMAVHVIEEKG